MPTDDDVTRELKRLFQALMADNKRLSESVSEMIEIVRVQNERITTLEKRTDNHEEMLGSMIDVDIPLGPDGPYRPPSDLIE